MSNRDSFSKMTTGWSRFLTIGVGVVVGLLLLDVFDGVTYAIVVSAGMLAPALLLRVVRRMSAVFWWRPDSRDLVAVAVLYVAVITATRLAFVGFTTD